MAKLTLGCCSLVAVVLVGVLTHITYSCNKQICGSIVSKCMLTQSCKCQYSTSNCTCCEECYNCLNYLYAECCDCVDMCPGDAKKEGLKLTSHADKLDGSSPSLFMALTMEQDEDERWVSFTFPVDFPKAALFDAEPSLRMIDSPDQSLDEMLRQAHSEGNSNVVTVNCTVAYVSQCMSLGKCNSQCTDMGASSMRWFKDGCCECVGHTCLNFGINESRCLNCSEGLLDDELDPPPREDELDYGEGMGPLDAAAVDHVNKL